MCAVCRGPANFAGLDKLKYGSGSGKQSVRVPSLHALIGAFRVQSGPLTLRQTADGIFRNGQGRPLCMSA